MRGLFGSLKIFFIIFLSGFGSSDVETSLISSEPTTQDPRSSAIHKGYSIYSPQNVAYKINYENMTWAEARNRCILDSGDLAIADTSDKIQYIRSISSGSQNWLYVGIHRPVGSQKWIRVDTDLPATSLPWISFPLVHSGYNCAATTYGFQLTDINCQWKTQSVCQISFHEDPITMKSGSTIEDLNEKITITTTTTTTMTTTTSEKLVSSSSASSHTPDGWKNTIISILFLTSVLLA